MCHYAGSGKNVGRLSMKTPIRDFVKAYAYGDSLRLHMPGHKGMGSLGVEHLDITEIDGADVLYHSQGIIGESEENASMLFGTARTVYSGEGSSLGIRAMLYLAMLYGKETGRAPKILAGRNAHKTFMTGAALLDIDVVWLMSENCGSVLSCFITEEQLDETLCAMEEKPVAVYLTNPDYLGNMVDLRPLARVCHKYGVMLLVDNAHGAYLRFLPESCHPMDQGADLCCDSAHKTLPVLTGGAYLHISKDAPAFFAENADSAMTMFASTSPSYLILQSLDDANSYLFYGYKEKLATFVKEVSDLKARLQKRGFQLVGNEALKLTIAPKSYGYKGTEVAEILGKQGIICEFSDPDYVVMMLTPELGAESLKRLETALETIDSKIPITEEPPKVSEMVKKLSIRQALFSVSEELPVNRCVGRILANASITCPPAIPILICGEEMTLDAVKAMEYYGILTCRVVKS